MPSPDLHQCRVFGAPWPGVYGVQTDSARSFGRHTHGSFGIGWLQAGAQRSASGRGLVEAFAGDLLAHNPGEVHDGRPLGSASRRWSMLHLEPAVLAGMTEGQTQIELLRPVMRDARLQQSLARALHRLQRWQVPVGSDAAAALERLACEEALTQACGLLLARHATVAPARQDMGEMRRVRERLADDCLQVPTLDELASLAGLGSKYQLLRCFARVYGLPPHAWLLQQRAERARQLIGAGAVLVDAALAAGFADQSHMTRVLVRQFGYTPGAWRQAMGWGLVVRDRA